MVSCICLKPLKQNAVSGRECASVTPALDAGLVVHALRKTATVSG